MSRRGATVNLKKLIPARFDVNLEEDYVVNSDTVLGEGGFGMVFIAKDQKQDNRLVAVKRVVNIPPEDDDDVKEMEKQRAIFKEEVRIMRELDHPHICKLFESFEEGNNLYFVMEFCPGGDMLTRLKDTDYLDEDTVATVVQQIGSALQYAHNHNIAHRDVKPENIVFTSKDSNTWDCKLIDWGLAEVFTGKSMRAAAGTYQYCAPEVLNPMRPYNNSCDLWSLGVVTHLALSGKLPFDGTVDKILQLAQRERYRLEGEVWDIISGDAKDMVRNLLKADPARRLTGTQLLRHPWIASARKRSRMHGAPKSMTPVLSNLRQFIKQNLLVKLCTAAVAKHLDHAQLVEIHQVFRHLDTNGDGVLTVKELTTGFKALFGADTEDFKGLEEEFNKLDLDGSGTLDYTEFCAAGIGMQMVQEMDAMTVAFKALDNDNKGYLTANDLKSALTSMDDDSEGHRQGGADRASRTLIKRLDKKGDEKADLDEWLNVWQHTWAQRQSISSNITAMSFSPRAGAPTIEFPGSGHLSPIALTPSLSADDVAPIMRRFSSATNETGETGTSVGSSLSVSSRNITTTYNTLRQISALNTVVEEDGMEGETSWA